MELLTAFGYGLLVLVSIEVALYVANKIVWTINNLPNPYAELANLNEEE